MIAPLRTALVCLALFGLAPLDSLDARIQRTVQASRRPALEATMRFASNACNGTTLCGGLLAVALVGGPGGLLAARTAVVALIPTNLAVESLKRLTDRARPDGEHRRSNAAFPSSHAANAFALAVVMARRWRRATVPLLLAAALIAASRVYLNRHWASDVVFGAALGALCAWWVARWMERRAQRAE